MNTDTAVSIGVQLYNLLTWRYLPIVVLMLTPITVYLLARNYVWAFEEMLDQETGKKELTRVFNRRQAMLLSGMAVAAPVILFFAYLFFKAIGV